MKEKVFISCPSVGEGNPATSVAVHSMLDAAHIPNNLNFLTLSSFPARLFHTKLSQSPDRSRTYTENSEKLRKGMALSVMGMLSLVEMFARNPSLLLNEANPYHMMVAVQEHQLSGLSASKLEAAFPNGRYLVIPDVEPKESAKSVMREKRIRPIVWNTQAYEKLCNLDPILVRPFLPGGFLNEGKEIGQATNRIVVKSSGSGMPDSYVRELQKSLSELNIPYSIYLPNEVRIQDGVIQRPRDRVERIREFYDDITSQPPSLLIASPSEMVQVAASLISSGTSFIPLPRRGQHEAVNLLWAQERELCGEVLDPVHDTISDRIEDELQNRKRTFDFQEIGLGIKPFYQALFTS